MLVQRWQAPLELSLNQALMILHGEGLEAHEENYAAGSKYIEHRHVFSEIRWVIEGELLVNISGNQILLRQGDRIEIPANTRHHYQVQGTKNCKSLWAQRVI